MAELFYCQLSIINCTLSIVHYQLLFVHFFLSSLLGALPCHL